MTSDYSLIRSALGFVTGENTHICRLCFASTNNHEVSFLDVVVVKKRYYENSLTILEMLDTLGVSNEHYLPQHLCGPCATSTINSFLFVKLCCSANDKWTEVLDTIEECLFQSAPISNCSKTAIFAVGRSKTVVTSRKSFGGNKSAVATQLSKLTSTKIHKQTHHVRCKCSDCGELFNSKTDLRKHMKNHRNKKDCSEFSCSQCGRRFNTKMKLTEHNERLHLPKLFICAHCSQMFGSERMLRRHNQFCHETVACKLCSLECASRRDLRIHLYKHEINKCTQCQKTFQNKQAYRYHVKNVCGNPRDPSYFCDVCRKGYVTKNSLRSHLKIDHGFGKTYDCDWCKKKHDTISRLRNHIVKHTKERNFYCEHCGCKFVTQPALTYHIRLHTGEKPYACELCDERFLSASRRAEHKRRKHFGPHLECTVCQSRFSTKHQLFKHTVRHSNPHSKLYVPSIPLTVTL